MPIILNLVLSWPLTLQSTDIGTFIVPHWKALTRSHKVYFCRWLEALLRNFLRIFRIWKKPASVPSIKLITCQKLSKCLFYRGEQVLLELCTTQLICIRTSACFPSLNPKVTDLKSSVRIRTIYSAPVHKGKGAKSKLKPGQFGTAWINQIFYWN